jgi:hypothetical protein
MPKIIIQLRDGIEEKWLMEHLTCIIEGDHFRDQFPYIKEGVTPRAWGLESHNDWMASLARRGEIGWNSEESRVEHDTLMVSHRYWLDALEALRPWLEYQFGRRGVD